MTEQLAFGNIRKMITSLENGKVNYTLPIGEERIAMNALIGEQITLCHSSEIHCVHCGRKTKKSFSQGFCYPCFSQLAQCDKCMMSPEKCHFQEGTCRDPEWAQDNCFIDHYVYLANSSGLKVGITRGTQIPTRWMDQGAVQALPILRVSTRQLSGLCEVLFKEHTADKTNWRKMLKNEVDIIDLPAERDRLLALVNDGIKALETEYGIQSITPLLEAETVTIDYPVIEYPSKVTSHNLDKTPEVKGKLMGIKGQYLILDTGVINLRKFGGYSLSLSKGE